MPADIIIYAVVAAGLALWLRNLLGTNPGDEANKPSSSNGAQKPSSPENSMGIEINLDVIETELEPIKPEDEIATYAQNRGEICAIDNKTAENGVLDILAADKNFDIKFFFEATQDVFAMVVEAFADGDREALQDMLAPDVYKAFEAAITAREAKQERMNADIHSITKSHIIEAKIDKNTAHITLRFEADETTVTYDKDDKIIIGNPDRTTKMTDIWTFSRDLKSKDPRWLVSETRGDFEDDNETLPNAG